MLDNYQDIKFKSIAEESESSEKSDDQKELIEELLGLLPDDVVDIKFTDKLVDLPSMIKQRGDISLEMEKALKNQPNAMGVTAEKVLEINKESKAYDLLIKASEDEKKEIINLLFDQAKLVEGLEIENPVEYTKNIWKLIK